MRMLRSLRTPYCAFGQATQEVTVSSNSVQVDTTSTQLGQVIDDTKMTTVPLNGRSFLTCWPRSPGSPQFRPE